MLASLLLTLIVRSVCPLLAPTEGAVLRPYAPAGPYGGHWGIDLGAEWGSPVHAAASGRVTFAAMLAGRVSVTIAHGGGVRTSYSYLSSRRVSVGDRVRRGQVIGESGVDHGLGAVHFSLRVGPRYVAPPIGGCRLVPADGLRLDPP